MFKRFLLLSFVLSFSSPSFTQDLVDLEGSGINNFGTFCAMLNLAAKSTIKARDKIGSKAEAEASELKVSNAIADIIYEAQLESGVSIDDVDPAKLGEFVTVVQNEYETHLLTESASSAPPVPVNTETEEVWTAYDIARTSLSVASIADPTGVVGVAAAYTYPVCNTPDAEKGQGGFCWKDSDPRGVGTLPTHLGRPADCPAGFTNTGLTCHKIGHTIPQGSRVADCPAGYTNNGATCGRGGHTIPLGSRVADCPAGYTNNGATCGRGGHTYWKDGCTTVFKKFPCREGYTDTGCTCTKWPSTLGMGSMSCKTGEFKTGARCYKDCPAGYTNTGEFCTKWPSTLGMGSMSCKTGEFKTGARCYKDCPAGYTNTGEFCTKWPEVLGMDGMVCPAGEVKDGARCFPSDACGTNKELSGGLCYQPCSNPKFTGIGPVCWSSCEGKLGTACAAGCATTALECGLATTDMVLSPIEVVVSVASIGTYSSAKSARKAATLAARVAAKEAAKEAAKAGVERAGRQLAKEALEKMSRKSVELLELDLVDALVKYGDDLAKEAADAKIFAEAEQAADFIMAANRIADANPNVVQRMGKSIKTSAKVAAQDMNKFAGWIGDNASRLKQSAKTNVFDPIKNQKAVKWAREHSPKKLLRSKSEVYDDFVQQKSKFNAYKIVSIPQTARQCAKFGITIAMDQDLE